jgi:hypothetical protein
MNEQPTSRSLFHLGQAAPYLMLLAYLLPSLWIAFHWNNTGDAGDSIAHYLFAHYAPQHIENYFHHWAKPFYVLLASPMAQFGFTWMKVFNILVNGSSLFLTYRIAQKLNLANASAAMVFAAMSPFFFVMMFSGLTEPLFALVTLVSIYLIVSEKLVWGLLLVSFLPFVRSEGLLVAGMFGLYLLWKREWKLLPLLAVGHIVYSLAGWFVHKELLWVFTHIPYALASSYGKGTWYFFFNELYYVVGVPVYILFYFGVLYYIFAIFSPKSREKISSEEILLVFGSFFIYFLGHSIFWVLGIFNTAGLKRVFVAVIPMMAITALRGLNVSTDLLERLWKPAKPIFLMLWVIYALIFPFTNNRGAVQWSRDMVERADQTVSHEVAAYIRANHLRDGRLFYTAHPQVNVDLDLDNFNPQQSVRYEPPHLKILKKGDIIVWDNIFSPLDVGVHLEMLRAIPQLKELKAFEGKDAQLNYKMIVFEYQ